MTTPETRLQEMDLTLPEAMAPVANYVPYVISGKMLFISGQISMGPDGLMTGKLGDSVSLEAGIAAAQACGLNILAQAKAATGNLDKIARCVKLGGFVASTPAFTDQPKVINGASDLMVAVLGEEIGRHSRAAVGVPALPLDAAVEIDAIFELV